MNIIIPMSGIGSRFLAEGYTRPKPLIEIQGRPMIAHVMDMYPGATNVVFVANNDHLGSTNMREVLLGLCPTATIVEVETTRLGPVPDVLKAAHLIADDEPTLVSYCDFTVDWDFEQFKKIVRDRDVDGAIVSYKGFHPHHYGPTYYGYLRMNADGHLAEIKEKESFTENRTEEYAAAGSYYFKKGAYIKKYFAEAVEKDMKTGREYFASLPYNLMVRDGLKTIAYEIPHFVQLGTPHDVRVFEYWARYFSSPVPPLQRGG